MNFRRASLGRSGRGFTLVETVISMGIVFIAGLTVVGAIIYTRQSLEINKQTLTAMNYARQALEAVSTNSAVDETTSMIIMRFNDPGLDVPANVELAYYPFESGGSVDWDNPTSAPLAGVPMYARVNLSWDSMGGTGRRHSVTMSSVIRAGTI